MELSVQRVFVAPPAFHGVSSRKPCRWSAPWAQWPPATPIREALGHRNVCSGWSRRHSEAPCKRPLSAQRDHCRNVNWEICLSLRSYCDRSAAPVANAMVAIRPNRVDVEATVDLATGWKALSGLVVHLRGCQPALWRRDARGIGPPSCSLGHRRRLLRSGVDPSRRNPRPQPSHRGRRPNFGTSSGERPPRPRRIDTLRGQPPPA
jgi:hypothetical protein